MRVMQVMAGAEFGGAEKFFDRLVLGLHKAGVQQHLIMRPYAARTACMDKHHIPYTAAPFRNRFDLKTPRLIKGALRTFYPEIVMTWMSRASQLCPKGSHILVARLGGYYDLKYYKRADHLIGNTQDIRDYFMDKGWPAQNSHYLPNFVDPPKTGARIKRSLLNTPEDAPLLLSLGRYHDDKGFDTLIAAMTQVPGAYLWLGGDGPDRDALEKQAAQCGVLDRVRFIPWQQDTTPLYNAADIYVCPSRVEPLGNVVIEAWAHKKPVIAANSAGPKGLIDSGYNGLLVPMNNEDALAMALNGAIQDPALRNHLAEGGFETYAHAFTEERVIEKYLKFFHDLLKTR